MRDSLTLSVSIFLWLPPFYCSLFSLSATVWLVWHCWWLREPFQWWTSKSAFLSDFWLFVFESKPPSSSLSTAPSFNPDAQRMEKIPEMRIHAPLGMSTIQFQSNRCHISASLWGSHAKREKGREGGRGEEQRNDQGGFWKAAGSSKSDLTCYNTSTHTNSRIVTMVRIKQPLYYLYIIFFLHTTTFPPLHFSHPVSRLSQENNKESNLQWIYPLFHWEATHGAFSFRLKGTIKVVRCAH